MSKSPGMSTFTGQFIDFLNPNVETVNIEDIAHSLSLICRFNGQCEVFYSVAQHCVYVSQQLPDVLQMAGLLHDAPEAYVGDVVGPLKYAMRLLRRGLADDDSAFDKIEESWARVVGEKFGQDLVDLHPLIKEADSRMLVTERRDIFRRCPLWPSKAENYRPYDFEIEPWAPYQAEQNFLQRFRVLCHDVPSSRR